MTIFESLLYSVVQYFFGLMHLFPEIWITAGLLLGIVLLIVWRVKKRGKGMLCFALALTICFSVFLIMGMYNAFFRPQHSRIDMTDEQLLEFGAYVVQKQDKAFLPNNGEEPLVSERPDETYIYKSVDSLFNSFSCTSMEYADAEVAKEKFEDYAKAVCVSEDAVLVSTDTYTVLAEPVEVSPFPDLENSWHRDFNGQEYIHIRVCFENKIIVISGKRKNLFIKSRFYDLAEKERFFDENYKLYEPSYRFSYI